MKKIIFILCIFLLSNSDLYSRSITYRIINNSNTTFYRSKVETNPEKGYCNLIMESSPLRCDEIVPGTEAIFKTTNERAFCGLEGFVEWKAYVNNKHYLINMTFDIPFVGGNEFVYSCSQPFVMKHFSGDGEGGEVQLVFELSGYIPQESEQAPPPPPPPPLALPLTGNKIFSGQINWDADETGLPPGGNMNQKFLNYLTTAFRIEILAPTQFARNADGSGEQTFNGMKGYFTNYEKLKNIKIVFSDSRNENSLKNNDKIQNVMSSKRRINFRVTNLPENIPFNISINTKNANWDTGEKTPKPVGQKESKWMVFIHEKNKTPNSISYDVFGAWFFGDGGVSSENISPIALSRVQQMKRNANLINFIPLKGELKRKAVSPIEKMRVNEMQQKTEKQEVKSPSMNRNTQLKTNKN